MNRTPLARQSKLLVCLSLFAAVAAGCGMKEGISQDDCLAAAAQGVWHGQLTLVTTGGGDTSGCPTLELTVGIPSATTGCSPGCTCTGGLSYDDENPDIAPECFMGFSEVCPDGTTLSCVDNKASSATNGSGACSWQNGPLPNGSAYDCEYGVTWTKLN